MGLWVAWNEFVKVSCLGEWLFGLHACNINEVVVCWWMPPSPCWKRMWFFLDIPLGLIPLHSHKILEGFTTRRNGSTNQRARHILLVLSYFSTKGCCWKKSCDIICPSKLCFLCRKAIPSTTKTMDSDVHVTDFVTKNKFYLPWIKLQTLLSIDRWPPKRVR